MKNSIEYLDKVIGVIEKPYFYEMGLYGIRDRVEQEYVLCGVYGFTINIFGKTIYDSNGKMIYLEYGDGEWEYDSISLLSNRGIIGVLGL
jgi:hypothetical protein